MKKNYLKISILLFVMAICLNTNAQTTLNSGDIVFVGTNSASNDRLAFMILVDITPNTTISFTNGSWSNTVWRNFANSDDIRTWDSGANSYSAGTVFEFDAPNIRTAVGDAHLEVGTVSINHGAGTFNMNGQDTFYAWQNTGGMYALPSTSNNDTWGNWLAAYTTHSGGFMTSGSANAAQGFLPSALTIGTNALEINISSVKGGHYNGSLDGTASELRTRINDLMNWETTTVNGTSNAYKFWPFNSTVAAVFGDVGSVPLSVARNEIPNSVSVYPNPVQDILNIEIANESTFIKASLNSVTGKLIQVYNSNKIDFSNIPTGMYLLSVETLTNITTKKVIKI